MSDIIGPTTIALSQSFAAFQFFLPKLSDVRKANAAQNPDMVGDVRLGEVASFTMCLGVGAIISSLTKSAVPVFVSFIIGAVLLFVYETALYGDRPMNPTGNTARSTDA